MALVRCPTHGLRYNDENPRGCPACDQEHMGRASRVSLMQELAKAASKREKPEVAAPAAERRPRPWDRWLSSVPRFDQRRVVAAGSGAIVVLLGLLLWLTRSRFVEMPHPAAVAADEVRPLPLNVRAPVPTIFAILGTANPQPHPTAPEVERYSYGTGLYVDALNGFVYSISIGVGNRSWRGLRVGIPEREAEGSLALLGAPVRGQPIGPDAELRSGYLVYPSAEQRPTRSLGAEVRPPNGCFDVNVQLQPRGIGLLIDGDARYSVAAREGEPITWVVTRIQVVDRSRRGPLDTRVC